MFHHVVIHGVLFWILRTESRRRDSADGTGVSIAPEVNGLALILVLVCGRRRGVHRRPVRVHGTGNPSVKHPRVVVHRRPVDGKVALADGDRHSVTNSVGDAEVH